MARHTRSRNKATGKKGNLPDGIKTLYGVGTLIVLLGGIGGIAGVLATSEGLQMTVANERRDEGEEQLGKLRQAMEQASGDMFRDMEHYLVTVPDGPEKDAVQELLEGAGAEIPVIAKRVGMDEAELAENSVFNVPASSDL